MPPFRMLGDPPSPISMLDPLPPTAFEQRAMEPAPAAYERYWTRIQRIEMATRDRYDAGRLPNQEYLQSKYHLLQAKIWLIEATAKKAGK